MSKLLRGVVGAAYRPRCGRSVIASRPVGRSHTVGWFDFLAVLLSLFLLAPVFAETAIPALQARVTDQAGVLDATARQALEAKLAAFEQAKGSQIAVLIVPSTQPEAIEQYSIRVVDAWKLGRKGVDDGVLLLLAMQDHTLRIEVGRGLEGAIPDAIAKRVIAEIITPYFQRGDFAGGVDAGITALIKLVEGEPLPVPAATQSDSAMDNAGPTILIVAVVLGSILSVFFGRLVGAGVAGTLAFFAGWWVLGTLFAASVAAVLAFVLTLIRGAGGGRSTGGGFGGGGFGGGGFGGGGGGFSGGGASGRW